MKLLWSTDSEHSWNRTGMSSLYPDQCQGMCPNYQNQQLRNFHQLVQSVSLSVPVHILIIIHGAKKTQLMTAIIYNNLTFMGIHLRE